MRKRLVSILLVMLFVFAPIFADVDWTEGKSLGNIPHKEISDPYISSMTKGNVDKDVLPYRSNLELVVEHTESSLHPLSYTLYLYENPHAYVPVTFTTKGDMKITISDEYGESINLNVKSGYYGNRIHLNSMHSLAFTEMMMGSRFVDIRIVDGVNVYTFRVDTRHYASAIVDMLIDAGVSEYAIYDVLHSERDIADFIARNMKQVVTTDASIDSLENLLKFMMDYAEPYAIQASAEVLWERSYDEWIAYFGVGDTEKAHDVLWFMSIERDKAPDVVFYEKEVASPVVEETPVVVEPVVEEVVEEVVEPVVEEVVEVEEPVVEEEPTTIVINEIVVDKLIIGGTEITEDDLDNIVVVDGDIAEEEVAVDEVVEVEAVPPVEEELKHRHAYIAAKTYGMGINVNYGETGNEITFPLGAAFDMSFFGGHHGVSIEGGYLYDNGAHEFEPGISYLYKLQKNNKTDVDFRFGAIANMKKVSEETWGYAFGGRLGLEMNFFMSEHSFFNIGMHVRALSPVFVMVDGFNALNSAWNFECEFGAGIGVAF